MMAGFAYAQSPVTVTLTSPSTQTSFSTNRNAVILRGTASSPVGIQRVTWWVRNIQTEGTAKGAENWEVDNLWLVPGTNELWITAYDFAGNKTTNIWFITYTPESTAPQMVFTAPVAGQMVPPGSQPKIAWYITGTPPAEWTRRVVVPDVIIDLYRNGTYLTRLSDIASGVTSLNVFAMNYPEGDGYQIRLASYEGQNVTSRYVAFSPVFRIGHASAPTIPKFSVAAPNGEEGNSITAKLGEAIHFRWQTAGGTATQQTIDNGVGSVVGRDSKLITTSQIGQFTYTLTASNSAGSASQSVTVNVVSNNIVNTAEVLHNGITLSSVWPPKPADYQDTTQLPPYLVNPPSLIPINTGRQLFVDDFLIESTNLTRQFHAATMHPGNPVLKPTTNVERSGDGPMAMPFSNGVFYDPADQLFKMWYMCGYRVNICYATSTDGVNWNKPNLDVVPGSNVVFKDTHFVDTYANWIDLEEPNPARRYKMMRVVYTDPDPLEYHLHYSADGIHWGPAVVVNKSMTYDRTSFFFNPFRKKWALSMKDVQPGPIRLRRYVEHNDLSFAMSTVVTSNPSSAEMLLANTSKWMKADALDTAHPNDPAFTPNLYAFDAAGYESLMLAQFSILRGNGNKPFGRPKLNEVYFGFSRDGFYWHRPNRQAMFTVNETAGSWNYGNVQPTGGGPIVVGDQMYFYFSGRGGRDPLGFGSNDSNGATGLAIMRRDGFASLNASTSEGSLITRRVTFDGRHLFVNAEIASGGNLCAEILNDSNQVIAPFSKANCQPFTGNSTKQRLAWTGASDLGSLIGQTVRFKFYLTNGKLYSFWVSPTTEGASRGYLGAGGPGYASYRDTGGTVSNQPSVSLTPAAQSVTSGQTATLSYSIANATSASITPALAGCNITLSNGVATGSCNIPTSATGTTTYVLQATGNGQTVSALATLTVTAIADTAPPVVTVTAPTQNLFPAGTTQVSVALTTNENATCRMSMTDVPFASMQLLTQTGALAHGFNVATVDGQNYAYLLRCSDSAGNLSATQTIQFSIASPVGNNDGNKALQFDGKTGAVSVVSSVAAPVTTRQWTMESWIKTTAKPADFQTILGNQSGNDLRLSPGNSAKATVSIYTGSFTNFIGSKPINDGNWHHVIAVRDNDKLYLYVDGQPDTDTDTRQPVKSVNSPTGHSQLTLRAIGNRGTASEWYEGQVDEVRLFNRAFSAQEVAARYNNGNGQPVANEASLHMGFSFNEMSGPAVDVTSSTYRGTLSGGVTRVTSARGGTVVVPNPAIVSFTASANSITLGQSVTLNWATTNASSAAINGTNCAISNPATGSCLHTPTTTGQFTLTLTASGNGQTVTRALTLTVVNAGDTQKPTVTIAPQQNSLGNAATIRLTGSAQDNVGVTAVNFTTDRGQQGTATGTNAWSADIPLASGANVITVRALDAAGNVGTATVTLTYDANTTDKTAPIVTVLVPQATFFALGTRQVAVEISTNESCNCRIATDPDTLFEAMTPFATASGTTGGTLHKLTIATQDGQLYARMIRCADAANNISAPAYFTFRVGGSDKALSLDGTTGYVEVPLDPGVSTLNWTLETWINTSATFTDFATVVGNRSGSDLRLSAGTNATVVVSTYNGQFTNMFGKRKVNDGKWHHIVGVREGDKLRIYVDGQLDSDRSDAFNTGFIPMNLPGTPSQFSAKAVGNRGTLSETYRGLLDNVRAYNRALTAAEIQTRFANGSGHAACADNGLLVGYDFNEDGAVSSDFSGNGRTGILRGTATRVSK